MMIALPSERRRRSLWLALLHALLAVGFFAAIILANLPR